MDVVNKWLFGSTSRADDDVSFGKNASIVSRAKGNTRSTVSSTSSAHICAKAEKAAVMSKLTALKDNHALEEEKQELNKQREQLRKRKETLELQSELDATTV